MLEPFEKQEGEKKRVNEGKGGKKGRRGKGGGKRYEKMELKMNK